MANNSVDKTIVDFGKTVYASLLFSDAKKLKAAMNIPGVESGGNEIVTLALQYIRLFSLLALIFCLLLINNRFWPCWLGNKYTLGNSNIVQ